MIQIGKLRDYYNSKKSKQDTGLFPFSPPVEVKDLQTLFDNIDDVIQQIPESERFNCYYTSFNSNEKFRTFNSINAIYFDIDHIDYSKVDRYIEVFFEVTQADPLSTVIVKSGYGLQFVIQTEVTITDPKYFDSHREYNKATVEKLQIATTKLALPGNYDLKVFDRARMMRLPNTQNRKPGKKPVMAELLSSNLVPQKITLQMLSGLPELGAGDSADHNQTRSFGTPDTDAVLTGCDFIKWCKTNGQEAHEPQVYALFSILGRLRDPEELARGFVKGFTGSPTVNSPSWDTSQKLKQAVEASGPRTCKNIQSLWSGCTKCPHFEKLTSPIQIKSEEHIATETTGFHTVTVSKNGTVHRVPCFSDLLKFFERKHPFKTVADGKMIYVWNGKFYEYMCDATVESFAQKNFKPDVTTPTVREFLMRLQRSSLIDVGWFNRTTERMMNFKNGVLNIDTMKFEAGHSPERGFLNVIDYDYDPNAMAPDFEKALLATMGGDYTKTQLLLEFFGYAISNDKCWLQRALVLEGEGGNGKSTILEVFEDLVGESNYSSSFMKDLNKEESRTALEGKLFNVAEEMPNKAIADSSVFKAMVTGNSVSARKLYHDGYKFRNRAKLIFSCNDMAGSHDSSKGYLRRFVIIPFDVSFDENNPDFDPDIQDKLLSQKSGIINLLLQSYHALKKRKRLILPDSVKARLQEYKEEIDPTATWIEDNGLIEEPAGIINEVSLEDVYASYQMDMKARGFFALNFKHFCRKMHKMIRNPDSRVFRKMQGIKKLRMIKIHGPSNFGFVGPKSYQN